MQPVAPRQMGSSAQPRRILDGPLVGIERACYLKGGVMDGDGVSFWTAATPPLSSGARVTYVIRASSGFSDDSLVEVDALYPISRDLSPRAAVAVSLVQRCAAPKRAVLEAKTKEKIGSDILRGKVAKGHLSELKVRGNKAIPPG